jgi:hypothetical protein
MSNIGQPLTVNGNLVNSGTLSLSTSFGGDMILFGNMTDNGTLNNNNRAIFFRGGNVQNVSGAGTFDIAYLRVDKTAGSLRLLSNMVVEGPSTGNAIELTSTSVLDLNGYTLTIGRTGVNSTFNSGVASPGVIRGGGNSSIIAIGNGALGTLRFDQTTDGTTNVLKNLTVNRASSVLLLLVTNWLLPKV